MTNPSELVQLYILLSYEKLQRATISQRHRPTEASLRNRLLVWRFLKKIENEPIPPVNYVEELSRNQNDWNSSDATLEDNDNNNNSSWFLDLNANCDNDFGIDMDIESNLGGLVENSNDLNNNFICDTINIDSTSDVNFLLKRAIGAERKQKSTSDNYAFNDSKTFDSSCTSETNLFEESEEFFHDLCAELANTTATLVSSTNTFHFSSSPEQTVMH